MKFIQFLGESLRYTGACAFGGLLLAGLSGCGRDDIQVYKISKEPTAATSPAAPLPAGWEPAPPGEMRIASFKVKGGVGKMAEISVIPLPGSAARDVDNVNRWRGAVSLPTLSEAEVAKAAQPVKVAGETAQLYEQAGPNSGSGDQERIIVAVLRHDDQAIFFKISGDDEVVSAQKPAFLDYLKNFNFASATPEAASTPGELPPSHPSIDNSTAAPFVPPSASAEEGKPQWQVPASWKETPGGQFLVAKFLISGAQNSQAAVNVSASGGGFLLNVNRWRGQLGLAPTTESEAQKLATLFDIPDGKATLIELAGTDPKTGQEARMVAVMVPQKSQTWFYKLMGNPALVGEKKDEFLKFVKSAKYTP